MAKRACRAPPRRPAGARRRHRGHQGLPLNLIHRAPFRRTASAPEAIARIPRAATIVISPGCSEPTALVAALGADAERLAGSTILSGLLLGGYPFLQGGRFRYGTWHVMPPAKDAVDEFYPMRATEVESFIRGRRPEVALVQLAPPDADGMCSCGVSSSYVPALIGAAELVIAEINPRMPRTRGARVSATEVDIAVAVDHPLAEYRSRERPEVANAIASLIQPLIVEGATVQTGIGVIPEAVLERLAGGPYRRLGCYGMGTDGVVSLAEAGKLRELLAVELMGTERLFGWADDNPLCEMTNFDDALHPARMARLQNFVSINTAVEVDLSGAVNSESVRGTQISGVGGGFDFIEGARFSPGGLSIIALASTAGADGRSTIVPRLQDVPTTVPRHTVNLVVTEHGVADLRHLSLAERARALVAIAHPRHRQPLEASRPE